MTAQNLYRKFGGMFAILSAMCLVLSVLTISPSVARADDYFSDCPTGNSDCAPVVQSDCETDTFQCKDKAAYCGCRWRPISGGAWYCYCIGIK